MITTLNNLDVVITGTLRKMTRANAFNQIILNGGRPHKKITGKTDVLILGKTIGETHKMNYSEEHFIDTLTEEDFYELIGA